jgi:hypothetical protein
MQLTGWNLLLIFLSPLAVIAVIMVLIAPPFNRAFDHDRPIQKEMSDNVKEDKKIIQEMIDGKRAYSKEEIDDRLKEDKQMIIDGMKKVGRARLEESGFIDTLNEAKRIFRIR